MKINVFLGLLVAGVIVGLPLAYRSLTSVEFRNFRTVEPGILYRSGQLEPDGFERIMREYGIRTVISLRNREDDNGVFEDQFEQDYCEAHGLNFFRIDPCNFQVVDGVNTGERNMKIFLDILDNPTVKPPVLIHCFAGIHRTGTHVAVYRMEKNGWLTDEAIAEMKSMGTPRTEFTAELDFLRMYIPHRYR